MNGMKVDKGFEKVGDLVNSRFSKKPPAYQWQDLALRIIRELGVPDFKRNSVFKVAKEHPRAFIETCLNDTKELCRTGAKWRYFFKLVENKGTESGKKR